MKAFLRDNLMIVVSVALPVVVIVLFALASVVPRLYVDPPRHNLLLALEGGPYETSRVPVRVELVVTDGRARARVFQVEYPAGSPLRPSVPVARLFEYVAASGTVREIPIDLPADAAALADGTEIPVPEVADARLVTTLRAPDGYEFQLGRESGGLLVEVFGGNRRGPAPRLRKNGAVVAIDLPTPDPYYYGNVRFLGWVVNDADGAFR